MLINQPQLPIALGLISDHFGIVTAFYVMAASALIATIPAAFFHKGKTRRDGS